MLVTHCKNCVFAKSNPQTGCALSRSEKLGVETTHEGFFMLDRFCNTFRPEEWLINLSFDEQDRRNEVVLEEVVPRIGFFILFDVAVDNAIDKLRITIDDIKNQHAHAARYVTVATNKVEYNEEIQQMLTDRFDFDTTEHHIVQLVGDFDDDHFIIDECFRHAKNGWIYVTSSGERVDTHLIDKIHQRINVDMKKLVVVTPYEKLNGLIFQAALFKFLKGNKDRPMDDGTIDDRPFLEKVADVGKVDPETLMTWDQFNES